MPLISKKNNRLVLSGLNGLAAGILALCLVACQPVKHDRDASSAQNGAGARHADSSEPLLSEINQLTFAGKRAGEGYFSADGSQLVFQSERQDDNPFYQIYLMDLETGDTERVSPGVGKTTCAWIHPDGQRILFSSTHLDPQARQKQQDELAFRASGKSRRYSWDYDENYDIFVRDGKRYVRLTDEKGYARTGGLTMAA